MMGALILADMCLKPTRLDWKSGCESLRSCQQVEQRAKVIQCYQLRDG